MEKDYRHDGIEAICLEVFGMLTASVTHEIKNTLSIINENAGLLQDLCGMVADEDAGIPIERVEATTATIMKQVTRSNIIMRNLNRFAHSNDKIPGQVDLREMLELMVDLTSRFAAMQKVSVSLSCPSGITIQANLLVLESLLFLTLRRLYAVCPENSTLTVDGQAEGTRQVIIRFFIAGDAASRCPDYPDLTEETLAQHLDATCMSEEGGIVIQLTAPPV